MYGLAAQTPNPQFFETPDKSNQKLFSFLIQNYIFTHDCSNSLITRIIFVSLGSSKIGFCCICSDEGGQKPPKI